MMLVVLIQDPDYATNIDDFISFGCNFIIGAIYGDEVGAYLKDSNT